MNKPLEDWKGDFGNEYTARNQPTANGIIGRIDLWDAILMQTGYPQSTLEVGCNIGQNLSVLKRRNASAYLCGAEPNVLAAEACRSAGFPTVSDEAQALHSFKDGAFDLVFTSGVLIHIDPDGDLHDACREIARVSRKWVVAIEYFSKQPREVVYRDRKGLLWLRDFGKFYMDTCGLVPVACGFAWQALTGLDDLTWWVLRKP